METQGPWRPPTFLKGFPGPRGLTDPPNGRFSITHSRICYHAKVQPRVGLAGPIDPRKIGPEIVRFGIDTAPITYGGGLPHLSGWVGKWAGPAHQRGMAWFSGVSLAPNKKNQ